MIRAGGPISLPGIGGFRRIYWIRALGEPEPSAALLPAFHLRGLSLKKTCGAFPFLAL